MTRPCILVIAGSDSGGGAGIQGDTRTAAAFGVHASMAITAVTVQNTLGVSEVFLVPPRIVVAQIVAVVRDIGADAIKIGMLGNAETIAAIGDTLTAECPDTPLIVDPVMVAKGGARLLPADALDTLKRMLLPRARLLTPNLAEAEILAGRVIATVTDMRAAAAMLQALGPTAVLLKGGHLAGAALVDVLAMEDRMVEFPADRIDTPHTHGTGCATATAIACCLARGLGLEAAVRWSVSYVRSAIAHAPGLGSGHGPLGHMLGQIPASVVSDAVVAAAP